jgi:exodeoxyribonuclease VII small subunit
MARRKSDPLQPASAMSFEDALAGLESIVESMEHENLPLEELVAGYEKGSILLERCESVLDSARQRIELITLRDKREGVEGDPSPPPDSGDIFNSSADADAPDDDDDIRLF